MKNNLPNILEMQLFEKCNANCIYCAYEQGYTHYQEKLPLDIIESTIKEVKPEWVWYEGGEVTSTDESINYLIEALKIASSYGAKTRINSNIQKLSKKQLELLLDAGLEFIDISFDTLEARKFAIMRGFPIEQAEKLFDEFINNLMNIIESGITVDLEATVTHYNIDEFIKIHKFITKLHKKFPSNNKILHGLQFLIPVREEYFELLPNTTKLHNILLDLFELSKETGTPIRICCATMVKCEYPDLYVEHPNIIWVDCKCGDTYAHIRANGNIMFCGFWDHQYTFGNLHNKSFSEIWNNNKFRLEGINTQPDKCKNCDFWHTCHNTCFGLAYSKNADFNHLAFPYFEKYAKKEK